MVPNRMICDRRGAEEVSTRRMATHRRPGSSAANTSPLLREWERKVLYSFGSALIQNKPNL